MLLLTEQILNGLQFGLLLFLLAAGLTLVFGIMDLVNLAHGSLYMIGAYFAATFAALTAIFDAPWLPLALALVWLLHPDLGLFGLVSAILLAVLAVLGDVVARHRLKEANAISPRAPGLSI